MSDSSPDTWGLFERVLVGCLVAASTAGVSFGWSTNIRLERLLHTADAIPQLIRQAELEARLRESELSLVLQQSLSLHNQALERIGEVEAAQRALSPQVRAHGESIRTVAEEIRELCEVVIPTQNSTTTCLVHLTRPEAF